MLGCLKRAAHNDHSHPASMVEFDNASQEWLSTGVQEDLHVGN